MVISINQPAFLPWLGYFHRIAVSDLHIVLDHVQFEKNSFTNRNRIKTPNGALWLTVPLQTSGKFGDLAINKLKIAPLDKNWKKRIAESIRQFYRKSKYFDEHYPFFDQLFLKEWESLSDLMEESNRYFLRVLEISTQLVYSSGAEVIGVKDQLVLNLCKQHHATTYLSGPLGKNYLNEDDFRKAGILLQFHNYLHPTYEQLYGPFESNLSILDLIFNEGPQSKAILMNGNDKAF